MNPFRLRECRLAVLGWVVAMLPMAARADVDACKLLTAAQVGAAIGEAVGNGAYVTPTFVKTCTWTPAARSKVKAVTLYTQTAGIYDGGKHMSERMVAMGKGAAITPVSLGDDAYYFVAGSQVGLLVKKGGVSFKVAVYATLPVAQKEALELALAKQVLASL